MKGAEARAAAVGARRAARVLAALEAAVRNEAPGDVEVTREADAIVLTGERLGARATRDPRLRGMGLLVRSLR